MDRILIATSNPGKVRDFAGIVATLRFKIAAVPGFALIPTVVEDGLTFEDNARKKAEIYSSRVPGELVLADDSGLEVDALNGAPGLYSARYAAEDPDQAESNSHDKANNSKLLQKLKDIPSEKRTARFVSVIAAARDGTTLATFRGVVEGTILETPRGSRGFGYDPLFCLPAIHKTLAEMTAKEKAGYSHRGAAFRDFLTWYESEKAAWTL
jgi:XTP/dITP diphosphohydrolase